MTNSSYPANQVLQELQNISALLIDIKAMLAEEPKKDDEEYITIKQAMIYLKMSRSSIYRMIQDERISGKKIQATKQGHVLILRRSIEELLTRNKTIIQGGGCRKQAL